MNTERYYIHDFIKQALREDIGDGDHTSLSCLDKQRKGSAVLIAKEEAILAGIFVAQEICSIFDNSLEINVLKKDGEALKKGDKIFSIRGSQLSILQIERLMLNFMQRMSGIATQTSKYVKLVEGLHTKILDTRKTTPCMRVFEKMAVKIGGGENHRFGLYDMIMIKDNHIDFAGGVIEAIERVEDYLAKEDKQLKIEIEVRNFDELDKVMTRGGIHRIMFDNFSVEDTRKAVKMIDGKYETESSGGITKETLRAYAECGVDYISVGALTHQIKSIDMSLIAT